MFCGWTPPSHLRTTWDPFHAGSGATSGRQIRAGRPAAGLDYIRYAASRPTDKAWFAIGGIDLDNVRDVLAAGARRIVVVRAIRDAADPRAAAAALCAALDEAARVGPTQ